MSDEMMFGIAKMPYEMAMGDEMSRRQFYANTQRLVAALEAARAERGAVRKALSRILENEASDWKAAEEFGGYVLDDELREEARAALQREQWIPVSERLPPEGVDVLVLHDYGQIVGNPAHRDCGKRYVYKIARRYGNGFLSDLLETGQVTHWMPLPEAPQPEEAQQ